MLSVEEIEVAAWVQVQAAGEGPWIPCQVSAKDDSSVTFFLILERSRGAFELRAEIAPDGLRTPAGRSLAVRNVELSKDQLTELLGKVVRR